MPPTGDNGPRLDRAAEPAKAPRCLFCGSTSAKRSREHVLRKAFKSKFPSAPGLSFARQWGSGVEVTSVPITQFDLIVKEVCRECNQGWLNDLENLVEETIDDLMDGRRRRALTTAEIQSLGLWAFVRSLLLTYLSPRGRAPREVFAQVYRERTVPPGCYVQLAASTHSVWEAGSHQSVRVYPGDHYLGFVAFGLDSLLFLTSISDSSPGASRLSLDVSRQPRLWFPGSFRWLSPPEIVEAPLPLLSGRQAQVAGVSLAVRRGLITPVDQLGQALAPLDVIPERFHSSLCWKDVG